MRKDHSHSTCFRFHGFNHMLNPGHIAIPFPGGTPAMFLPNGSFAQYSAPQSFNEKGGLAITQSKFCNSSPSKNAGCGNIYTSYNLKVI